MHATGVLDREAQEDVGVVVAVGVDEVRAPGREEDHVSLLEVLILQAIES